MRYVWRTLGAALGGILITAVLWGGIVLFAGSPDPDVLFDFHTKKPVECITEQSMGHRLPITDPQCVKALAEAHYNLVWVDPSQGAY